MRLKSLIFAFAAIPALAASALAADQDSDGVDDQLDRCPWVDDGVDLDANSIADCAETILPEFGFQNQAATTTWYTPRNSFMNMSYWPDDLGYYWGSGAGRVYTNASTYPSLVVNACIPVDHWRDYMVMAQAGNTKNSSALHDLLVTEFTGPNCTHQLADVLIDFGTSTCYVPTTYITPRTLKGIYNPPIHVRSVKIVVRTLNAASSAKDGVFDNISMHPLPGSKGNPHQGTFQPPLPPKH